MNEMEIRLAHEGALVVCGKVVCSVHPRIELSAEGSCVLCAKTDAIIAASGIEAQAMNAAQAVYENDNEVWH